jgi:hypothetical protein
VYTQHSSSYADNGHVLHQANMRLNELVLLAGRIGLVDVALCGHLFVNTYAVHLLRTTVVAPFAHLKRLEFSTTTARDAVNLIELLPQGALTKLKVDLACGHVAPVLQAVVEHQQNLKQLRLRRCRRHAGAELRHEPVPAAHFHALSQLRELEDFGLAGGEFDMNIDEWRTWLTGLPNLLHLDITSLCILPPEAIIEAGHCCRKLNTLRLNAPTITYTAIEDNYDPLPFPQLTIIHMSLSESSLNSAG